MSERRGCECGGGVEGGVWGRVGSCVMCGVGGGGRGAVMIVDGRQPHALRDALAGGTDGVVGRGRGSGRGVQK